MNAATIQNTNRFQKLAVEPGSIVGYTVKIVAVRGAIGDWAVYMGNPDATDDEVAQYGHKLRPDNGRAMFPNVGGLYRE